MIVQLARRFLFSRASDGFISLITWVSVIGVTLGVMALTVVTSVINGFEGELSRVITSVNGDVVLFTQGNPVSNSHLIEEKIRQEFPEARFVTPSFISQIMASGPHGVSGAVLEGLEVESVGAVTDIPSRLIGGRMPSKTDKGQKPELVLGKSLADKLGAEIGSEVRLIVPFLGDGGQQVNLDQSRVFIGQVVGIVHLGMHEYDSRFIYSTLATAQGLLQHQDQVTNFRIKLTQPSDPRQVAEGLNELFGWPFRARSWEAINPNIFYAIELEKRVIAIILTAIILVAMFNVASALMMMIHDKGQEISILKAMGFRPSQGFRMFCMIGLGIGAIGTLAGVMLGMGVNLILEKTRLIELHADVYHIGFLPVVARSSDILMVAGFALLVCLVATLIPAIQVARRAVLTGLKEGGL